MFRIKRIKHVLLCVTKIYSYVCIEHLWSNRFCKKMYHTSHFFIYIFKSIGEVSKIGTSAKMGQIIFWCNAPLKKKIGLLIIMCGVEILTALNVNINI